MKAKAIEKKKGRRAASCAGINGSGKSLSGTAKNIVALRKKIRRRRQWQHQSNEGGTREIVERASARRNHRRMVTSNMTKKK